MPTTRRHFLALAASGAVMPGQAMAQNQVTPEFWAQYTLVFGQGQDFVTALGFMLDRGTPDMAAGVILAMRFARAPEEVFSGILRKITGEPHAKTWHDWMLWQEANPQIKPHESFIPVKRALFLQLDPGFEAFLIPAYIQPDRMKIRLEEIVWGGVRADGILPLDSPNLIPAQDADYLAQDDLVFGVSINGDARAYPLRIMGWHEMFNDVIGGVPVALAYCTLCGSGILYETARAEEAPFVFGSSGFLYRSNKLMFDRQTNSLWNQFTGKPVVGPLVDSQIALPRRPVVVDTWANWVAANPETQVLSLNTGFLRDYRSGAVYSDYFASPDLMFPAVVDQTTHQQKDYVFAVEQFGAAKAWPLDVFEGGRVLNDAIAQTPLVLIGDKATRTVRAYQRGDVTLAERDGGLVSQDGATWAMQEDDLVASDGRRLPRVAGAVSYWFAWNGYRGDIGELFVE